MVGIGEALQPLFTKHGVDLYNAGHVHSYESIFPLCDFTKCVLQVLAATRRPAPTPHVRQAAARSTTTTTTTTMYRGASCVPNSPLSRCGALAGCLFLVALVRGELCDGKQSFDEPKGTIHITEGTPKERGVGA